ncbi:MAG: hypothetical protein Q8P72_03475 [Candidatus Roizmanbacteria bacterium]|nr:hypothetical protein [Candidatus Roizmanbacteria bacterium]
MHVDLNSYKKLYLDTASAKLSDMTALFEKIAENQDPQAIADFHRFSHSIKSQSLVMGYAQLGLAGKILEALFRAVKEGRINLNEEVIHIVRQTITSMKASLQSIQNQTGELNLSKEIQSLEEHTPIRLLDP